MKNSRLFFQLILSRGVGVPFPIMSTFYIISMNLFLERKTGLEPATFSLEGWRSSQLSYFRVNILVIHMGFEPTSPSSPEGYPAVRRMDDIH